MRSVGSRTDVRVSMSRTDLLIGPPWWGQNTTLTPSFIHAVIARILVGRTSKRILSHASGSTSLACGAEMGKQQDDPCYENIRNSENAFMYVVFSQETGSMITQSCPLLRPFMHRRQQCERNSLLTFGLRVGHVSIDLCHAEICQRRPGGFATEHQLESRKESL